MATLNGYWKLDETSGLTAADSSGHGLTGTAVNAPQWIAGRWTNCIHLDGADEKMIINDSPYLNVVPQSIAIWFNKDDNSQTLIFSKTIYPNIGYYAYYSAPSHKFGFFISCIDTWRGINSTNVISTGAWHFAVIIFTASKLKLYIDGAFDGETLLIAPPLLGNYNLCLGDWTGGSSTYFNGAIDEVRIFDGALVQSEITYLYNENEWPSPLLCWNYTAKYKNSNRLYTANGSGKHPSELIVPSSVDISSGKLIDEGKLINPNNYKIRS